MRSPQHLGEEPEAGTRWGLQSFSKRRHSLRFQDLRSRIRTEEESTGILRLRMIVPSPLVGEGSSAVRHRFTRVRGLPRQGNIFQLLPAERTPHPSRTVVRDTFSHKGRREGRARRTCASRRRGDRYCVLGARGLACVMNCVASSIAVPSGVGITMRNGTRKRVPAIGANAISILRADCRYLITGRSGM